MLAETLFLPRSIVLLWGVLRCFCHVPASNSWSCLHLSLYAGITEGRRYWKCQHHEIILPPMWNLFSVSSFARLVKCLLQRKNSWSERALLLGLFHECVYLIGFLGLALPAKVKRNSLMKWSSESLHKIKAIMFCKGQQCLLQTRGVVQFSYLGFSLELLIFWLGSP